MTPVDFITSLDGPWLLDAFTSDFWNMIIYTAVIAFGAFHLGRYSKSGAIGKLQDRVEAERDKADHLRISLMALGFSRESVDRAATGGTLTRDDVVSIIHEEVVPMTADEIDEIWNSKE